MFKRLKDKISEEVWQSPLRLQTSVQSLGQYSPFKDSGAKKQSESPSTSSATTETETINKDDAQNLIDLQENSSSIMDISESHQFSIADDDGASSVATSPVPQAFENIDLSESVPAPIFPLERNRSLSVSSTGSQPPLLPTYHSTPSSYCVQSDLESASEVEDSGLNLDLVSKDQLYQAFLKAKSRYLRYKSRYGDVVRAYREQVNEKDKIKTILTESQDKALRRISELREQSQLDQKAKVHLEESFRVTLEEKDELLKVLQTQIRLLKSGSASTNEDDVDSVDPTPLIDVGSESIKEEEEEDHKEGDPEQMTSKIKTYEETITKLKGLLKNCKDIIAKQRETNIRLMAERDQVNGKLNETSAQVKRMMEEKSEKDKELLNELVQATATIEKLKKNEEENVLSLAEAKHEMHKEMESKEQEIQSMKQQLKQVLAENEELLKTVEVKSRAVAEMEEDKKSEIQKVQQHLEETERKLEEEKQSLVQELSCAKAAAVKVMQQEAEKRLNELQEEHSSALKSVEQEWRAKLDAKVQELEEKNKLNIVDLESSAYSSLEKQCKTLKEELEEKNKMIDALHAEKVAIGEQLQSVLQYNTEVSCSNISSNECQMKDDANTRIKDSLVRVVMLLKEFQAWKLKLKEDFAYYHQQNANSFLTLTEELSKLVVSHDTSMQCLDQTIERITMEKENKVNELEREQQNLTEQIRAARISYEENAAGQQCRLDKLQDKITQLTTEISNLESKLEECNIKLTNSLSEIDHCKSIICDKDSVITDIRIKNDELQTSLKEEKERLNSSLKDVMCLEQQLKDSKAEISSLNKELQAANQSQKWTEANLNQTTEMYSELQKNSELLEATRANLCEQIVRCQQDAEESCGRLSSEVNELRVALVEAKKESEVWQNERDLAMDEAQRLNQRVVEFENEIFSLKEQNDKLEETVQSSQEIANRERETLINELSDRQATVEVLDERNAQLSRANRLEEQLRQQLTDSQAKVALLETMLLREREVGQELILARDNLIKENRSLDSERDMIKVDHDTIVSEVVQAVGNLNECLNSEIFKSDSLLQTVASLRMELVAKESNLDLDLSGLSENISNAGEKEALSVSHSLEITSNKQEPGCELLITIRKVVSELNKLEYVTERLNCEMEVLRELFNSISSGHEQHVHELNQAMDSTREELRTLSGRNEKYEEQIAKSDSVIDQLEGQCTELKVKLNEYDYRLKQQGNDLQRVHREQLVQLQAAAQQAMDQLREQLKGIKNKLPSEQNAFQEYLQEFASAVAILGESLQYEKTTKEELVQSMVKAQEEQNQLRENLTSELELLRGQLTQHQSELQVKTEENVSQNSMIITLKKQVEDSLYQLSNASLERTELQQQIQELGSELSVVRLECEQLATWKTQFECAYAELQSKSKDVFEFQQAIEQLEVTCANLRSELEAAEAQITLLQETAGQRENHISDLKGTASRLQEENETLHLTVESNMNELNGLRCYADNCRILEAQLDANETKYKEEMERAEKQHKDKINELTQKFKTKLKLQQQEHNDKMLVLEERLNEMNLLNNELSRDVSVYHKTIERLEEKIRDMGTEIRNQLDEGSRLKDEIKLVQSEGSSVTKELQSPNFLPDPKQQTVMDNSLLEQQLCNTERQEYENKISLINQQLKELESSVHEKDGIVAELRHCIEELNEEKQSLSLQLKDAMVQTSSLNTSSDEPRTFPNSDQRVVELEQQLRQAKEDHQSKLTELKKRAENKLAQIKKQMQMDAERCKEELQGKIVRLEEQRLNNEEQHLQSLAIAKENALDESKEQILRLENSILELRFGYDENIKKLQNALEKEKMEHLEEREKLQSELNLKNMQIDESLITAQVNHTGMVQKLSQLQQGYEEAKANWQQRELDLTSLITSLRDQQAAIKTEKNPLEKSLTGDSCTVTGDNVQEQLRKDNMNEEHRLRLEHSQHIKEMTSELHDKEETLESLLQEKDIIIQEKDNLLASIAQQFEEKMLAMKNEHSSHLESLERRWKVTLQKELKQQTDKHEEEMSGLTQEWEIERRELVKQASLTSSVVESGNQSSDLLRRQVIAMQMQIETLKERHKAEVTELRHLLQASNCPVPLRNINDSPNHGENPALESLEIEYLKNILFEYMMGRETLTLAKVIAAVVRFSDEQLVKILEKEEARISGVGSQFVQFLK